MKISEDYLISIPKPFNRLNDVYFKYVLASPERKDITINFLNAVLNHLKIKDEAPILIEDIEFLDRETVTEIQTLSKKIRLNVLFWECWRREIYGGNCGT